MVFIVYVPPCCDGSDPFPFTASSTLPDTQLGLVRLRGGTAHLSGKKRKAPETPEDAADGTEKHQTEDSSSGSSKPDNINVDKELDDSTVILEGGDLPSDLHESGRTPPAITLFP